MGATNTISYFWLMQQSLEVTKKEELLHQRNLSGSSYESHRQLFPNEYRFHNVI